MFIYTRDCGFCPYVPTSYAIFWVTGDGSETAVKPHPEIVESGENPSSENGLQPALFDLHSAGHP